MSTATVYFQTEIDKSYPGFTGEMDKVARLIFSLFLTLREIFRRETDVCQQKRFIFKENSRHILLELQEKWITDNEKRINYLDELFIHLEV